MALVTVGSAETVIGCAIRVHARIGPGVFESVYLPCLAYELAKAGLHFKQQVTVPLVYDGLVFDQAFRADLIVEDELIVEVKSVEQITPVHLKQLLTYLRLTGLRKGLLINFKSSLLKDGIRSVVA